MHVFPVINCVDGDCARHKMTVAQTFLRAGDFVHIDVADGIFTFHKTWNDTAGWAALRVPFRLEVHLMVEHPERYIEPWLAVGARRFIIHVETLGGGAEKSGEKVFNEIVAKCAERGRERGAQVMLSSNPETPAGEFRPYFHKAWFYQVLAVHPGLAGQKFLPSALNKIRFLKKNAPDGIIIEVDGGINPETAKLAKEAGADIAVSASWIFENDDPRNKYEELRKI
jgi:ribulose-phosphate 3-epimerase